MSTRRYQWPQLGADQDFSDGMAHVKVVDPGFVQSSELVFTRIIAQGTAVATGTPALTYSVDLSGIDMDTATVVLVTSAGTVTVEAQVSFDGATNKAPSTPVVLFNAVTVGTYIIGLKNILVSGSNPIYGHYMTGDIDIASAASNIDLYLMAQGK